MSIGGSGGGYFYGPFRNTEGFNFTGIASGGIGVYGPWTHQAIVKRTAFKGRWLAISAWPQTILLPGIYQLQIGLGLVGAEVAWQPSDGSGFYFDWFFSFPPWNNGFPISINFGQEISLRIQANVAPASLVDAHIYIFS